jgi:hypothetical protein
MAVVKRVLSVEPEGPDSIVTLSVSGFGTKASAKNGARGRAILEAGLNVPKSLKERERVTKLEDVDIDVDGRLPTNSMGRLSGTVTVRVRNSR